MKKLNSLITFVLIPAFYFYFNIKVNLIDVFQRRGENISFNFKRGLYWFDVDGMKFYNMNDNLQVHKDEYITKILCKDKNNIEANELFKLISDK